MADIEFTNEPEMTNNALNEAVAGDSVLKEWLVDFVGNKHNPDDGQVTVEMVVHTMAEQFPELLMAIAEENWIRGYQQAIHDVELGEKIIKEEQEQLQTSDNHEDEQG